MGGGGRSKLAGAKKANSKAPGQKGAIANSQISRPNEQDQKTDADADADDDDDDDAGTRNQGRKA